MPHLSPMHWLFAIMTIWLTTTLLMSISWWHQPSLWPNIKKQNTEKSFNKWNW